MYRVYYRDSNKWNHFIMTGSRREALTRAAKLSTTRGLALVTVTDEDVVVAVFEGGNELRVGYPLWK